MVKRSKIKATRKRARSHVGSTAFCCRATSMALAFLRSVAVVIAQAAKTVNKQVSK